MLRSCANTVHVGVACFPDGRRVALIDASVLEDSSLSDADVLYDRSHPRELVSEAQTEFLEDKNG